MKKIIFCLQSMILGGVEKELITILKQIHGIYDITVLLMYQEDMSIIKDIPDNVKVKILNIEKNYYCSNTVEIIKQRVKKGHLIQALSIAVKKIFKIGMTSSNTNIDDVPVLYDEYDTAICYHIHSPLMLKYVATKINARKKIGWIHNDFYASGYPIQRLKKFVVQYYEFVAVSKKVENEFRTLCHWYEGGISTAHNYLNDKEIIELSKETIDESIYLDEKKVRILTVGRFSEQKGIDMAIQVCSMLKNADLEFHWFLIGYGELENSYRQLIKELDVENYYTILGKKHNPYPYIRNCDICVQPSRHEAYPLVIMEAKILKKPIICTNFDGADEQIDSYRNGIIVPLGDTEALCKEISKLIMYPELRENLTAELSKWKPGDDLKEIVKHFE